MSARGQAIRKLPKEVHLVEGRLVKGFRTGPYLYVPEEHWDAKLQELAKQYGTGTEFVCLNVGSLPRKDLPKPVKDYIDYLEKHGG